MFEKLRATEPTVLVAWMYSAAITGFGLGMLLAKPRGRAALWITAVSAAVHGWMMYRIYARKHRR